MALWCIQVGESNKDEQPKVEAAGTPAPATTPGGFGTGGNPFAALGTASKPFGTGFSFGGAPTSGFGGLSATGSAFGGASAAGEYTLVIVLRITGHDPSPGLIRQGVIGTCATQ